MINSILKKITNKELKIAVLGLGYVGLPLSIAINKAGFIVIGLDYEYNKIESISKSVSYIADISDEELKHAIGSNRFKYSSDPSSLQEANCYIICVPTPLDVHQQPDLSYIKEATKEIGKHLKYLDIVVLESTTYPGTTDELIKPLLEEISGLKCGEDFFLGFSPERVDPGNNSYKTVNTPKIVGGINNSSTIIMSKLYEAILDSKVVSVSNAKVAEMTKLLENTYRHVNIGLVNEFAIICNEMGINVWEVIDAAKTKPYGYQAFYPGPGLGGHCIPLDPFYLTWKVKEFEYHPKILEASGIINDYMPSYVCERSMYILNSMGKALKGSNILIVGIAYKENISDYRESPALKVLSKLEKNGAIVDCYDPFVPIFFDGKKNRKTLSDLNPKRIESYDLVIITTAHSNVDYNILQANSKMIFDTKNATSKLTGNERENLILI